MKRMPLGAALLCVSLAFWSCTPSLGSDSSGGVSGELRGDVTWSADANSFSYCSFSGADSASHNYAVYVYTQYGTAISLDHCEFNGNKAGGLDVYACSDISEITNCVFEDNGDSAGGPPYDLLYKDGLTLDGSNTGSSLRAQA